jgi:hypothetical protein
MWLKRGKENSYNMLPFWLLKQDHPLIDFEATKYYTKTLAL